MEIIPKESFKASSKGLNILFYFVLVLLLFSIAGFFILGHFLSRAKGEFSILEKTLTERVPEETLIMKREVFGYQHQINNFSFILERQAKNSKFFNVFEGVIHPEVWFSEFALDSETGMVTLSGQAESFEVLWQQLFTLQGEEWLKDVVLGTVLMDEDGGVNFTLSISFDPIILFKNEQI